MLPNGRSIEVGGDSFGALLRGYRGTRGLTQEQLAERSGLNVHAISMLERGVRRSPRSTTVEFLAEALKLDSAERRTLETAARRRAGATSSSVTPDASPDQLPLDAEDFTGRREQLARLCELLTTPIGTTALAAVSGRAGVGKTTLAVHAAHLLRHHFPDGQLHIDLRGMEPRPRHPREVLASLLGALGVPGHGIPDDLDARGELYRARLAERRVLVVLDNASEVGQVRPLLPGSPTCAVLITSRSALPTLVSPARRLELDVLTPDEAVELLAQVAGHPRVHAEPQAARQVARLCDHLPLALRIAGAKLAARPHWSLERLVDRLVDERYRLDELSLGDLEVRTSIGLSYEGLDPLEQVVFRRLGLLDAVDVPYWVAGALADLPPDAVDDLLERLCDARLLEVSGSDAAGQTRFRLHDLVRLYAHGRAMADDPPAERASALDRTLGAWCGLAGEAERRLVGVDRPRGCAASTAWEPGTELTDALLPDPSVWFESEWQLLVASVAQACEAGLDDHACDIAAPLATYLSMVGHLDAWQRVLELVRDAAGAAGNVRAEAMVELSFGNLLVVQDRYEEGLRCFERSRSAACRLGDRRGEAAALQGIGFVLRMRSRYSDALAAYQKALVICGETADLRNRVFALLGVGSIHVDRGEYEGACADLAQALVDARAVGCTEGEARALRGLAQVARHLDRLEESVALLEQAGALWRRLGDRPGEAVFLQAMGDIQVRLGHLDRARSLLEECLSLEREFGDRFNEALALGSLGDLHRAKGDLAGAIEHLHESHRIYDQLGLPLWRARTLHRLGAVHALAGDYRRAAAAQRQARSLLRALDLPDTQLDG